jgi:hypothetical protein
VQRATAGYDSLPLGMNQHEVLTLASIVESESRANDERPRIARAYLNRLERGMLLQADPTVGYALGRGPRSRLLFKDLRVESPYNTYRHEGLPPGPICSPGESAIQAVMNATPGTNDLYFVANGKGRHIFAPTYQQHLENIAMVKSRMKAESMAAARTAAALKAVDDELVVGGAIGDSGAVRPPGATAPDATNASTPGAPAGATPSGAGRVKAPPVVSLSRLPAVPSTQGSAPATKPAAGLATTSKSVASSTTAAKPTATKPTPATPTASGGNTTLKGDLLVPRRSATVASSTPGSVEVVHKPVPKPAATDASPAKAGTANSTATKSTTTDASKSKSTATTKPATKATTTDAAKLKSTTTTKPATKSTTTDASTSKSSTTKPAAKPATTDPAPAKSASAKPATKPASKPAAADTSHKKPAAKKQAAKPPAPKPAPKDTTR